MVLDFTEKEQYIDRHLFNELRWLLNAATEWSIQKQLNLEICGYDIQVYAMDSAFVHARSLFEFFLEKPKDKYRRSCQFHDDKQTSSSYNNWREPLHAYLMHLGDRSRPAPLKSSGVEKPLNRMPVDFANEILRLWVEFEEKLEARGDKELAELAREKRKQAIKSAECVVNSSVAKQHAKDKHKALQPVFL